MPSFKRFYNDIRAKLQEELCPFPDDISSVAFSLEICTLSKTKYTSHINFIGTCLKHGVTPVGFRTRFHPSLNGAEHKGYRKQVRKQNLSDSRKLMRTTLTHMCRIRDDLSAKLTNQRTSLHRLCENREQRHLYNRISQYIHTLNRDLFTCTYLNNTKQGKLEELHPHPQELTLNLPGGVVNREIRNGE